jgi:GxxExxY protein
MRPGLIESTYEKCHAKEFTLRRIPFEEQRTLPLTYNGLELDGCYRLDFLISNLVVVEVKAVDLLLPLHQAQLLSYLKLGGWKIGLSINFHVPVLKQGIKRLVLGL